MAPASIGANPKCAVERSIALDGHGPSPKDFEANVGSVGRPLSTAIYYSIVQRAFANLDPSWVLFVDASLSLSHLPPPSLSLSLSLCSVEICLSCEVLCAREKIDQTAYRCATKAQLLG